MEDVIEALQALEDAALGNDRLDTLGRVDSPELREILNYAMSPDITFGIKQLPEAKPAQVATMARHEWWPVLRDLLDELAERRLTGNAAKSRIGSFLGLCDPTEEKWAARILLQDLRLSIGATAVNNTLGGTVIRKFKLPLAKPFKELKSLKGSWYLQPKLDGGRCVAEIDKNGKVRLTSRSGKEWGSAFRFIKKSVEQLSKDYNLTNVCLDGELVIFKNGRMDFQAIQKMFHVVDDRPPDGDLRYVLFDLARGDEYHNPQQTYQYRYEDLQVSLGSLPLNIDLAAGEYLENPTQEYLDAKAVEFVQRLGCDGAIIRRADKVPSNKKSSDITKVKPFEDGEAVVIGKVEGKGHLEGSLGTMVCRMLVDKKPFGPEFEIGTGEGLTKDLRQELWNDPKLVGSLVNLKFQRLSDDGVPVLPTYRAIRHPDDM